MNRKLTVTIISEIDVDGNPSEYMDHPVNILSLGRGLSDYGPLADDAARGFDPRECESWEELCACIEENMGPCHFAPVFVRWGGVCMDMGAPTTAAWDCGLDGVAFMRKPDCWGNPADEFRHYAGLLDMYINNRGAYWFQVVGIDAAELAHVRGDSFLADYLGAHGERLDSLCGSYYEEQYPSIMVRDIGLEADLVLATFGPYANQLIPYRDGDSLDGLLAGPAA